MIMMTETPLLDADWLEHFEQSIFKAAESQMVAKDDSYRLTALAMAITLTTHQVLSHRGRSPKVWHAVKQLCHELRQQADIQDAEIPSLSNMTIIMDIAATAFSLIDHRRMKAGDPGEDVQIERIADGLFAVMRRACAAGGSRTSASLLHLLTAMLCYDAPV